MDATLSILVIEDNEIDYRVIDRSLQPSSNYQITWAKTLAQGLAELSDNQIDIVLLDLSLPDSQGLESISSLSEHYTVPVIVLTGMDDETVGLTALQHGIQDFLVKGNFDKALLIKSIKYAIERHSLRNELHEVKQSKIRIQRELKQEQQRVQTTFPTSKYPETARTYGQLPLKESDSDLFAQVTKQYCVTLEHALEQRAFKVEYNVTQELRDLANTLGSYKATPRDVVEIHTATLSIKTKNIAPGKTKICNEEGRYLLMGLLGHLCTFYRNQSLTLPTLKPSENCNNSEPSTLENI